MIVVDASAFVEILLQTPRSDSLLQRIAGAQMAAPDLINVEVLSALKRLARTGAMTASRADQATEDLRDAPILRFPTLPLLGSIWKLRSNLSMYDASYVSLAQALNCQLVTGDVRLAQAPNLPVRVLTP